MVTRLVGVDTAEGRRDEASGASALLPVLRAAHAFAFSGVNARDRPLLRDPGFRLTRRAHPSQPNRFMIERAAWSASPQLR